MFIVDELFPRIGKIEVREVYLHLSQVIWDATVDGRNPAPVDTRR